MDRSNNDNDQQTTTTTTTSVVASPVVGITVQPESNRLVATPVERRLSSWKEMPERENPFQSGGELQQKADFIVTHSEFSPTRLNVIDPDSIEQTELNFDGDEIAGEIEVEVQAGRPENTALPQKAQLCQLEDDTASRSSSVSDGHRAKGDGSGKDKKEEPPGKGAVLLTRKPSGAEGHPLRASSIKDSRELLEENLPTDKDGKKKKPDGACRCCVVQ